MHHLSEQEQIRRDKLQKIQALNINPYPADLFPVDTHAADLHTNFEEGKHVCMAGRFMAARIMGKASFAELMDGTGRIQLYINRDEICPNEDKALYNDVFKKLLDLGDFIGIKGHTFLTQTGERSVHVSEFVMLGKALRPLPVTKTDAEGNKYDEFTDPELRYRQRYVDLVVNPHVRQIFAQRSKTISTMRRFFDAQGWLEVETPILQPIHGGAAARPFATHHNTLDVPLYMRIANELYLKRLIVGGFEGVYEFGKMFRNEGMDRTHNPEFTAMELYVAYKDYDWMMNTVEELLANVAEQVTGSSKVKSWGNEIEFKGPYRRLPILDGIKEYSGYDVATMDEDQLRNVCRELHIHVDKTMGKGKLIDKIFGEVVEPHLVQPTFVTDYPVEMSPLTKKHRSKEGLVERFELFINCKEVANAYSELNDPIDQRERFEEQLRLAGRGDDEAMPLDEDFLRALEYGMPPTAGVGIGIDRLVMMLTDQTSIQEVLFFPQMRPEDQH